MNKKWRQWQADNYVQTVAIILTHAKCPECGSTTLTVKHGKLLCNDCGEIFDEGDAK